VSGIDWHTILGHAAYNAPPDEHGMVGYAVAGNAILAARVPQACSTCEGKPWMTQLVCCGRDSGSWRFATHAEADALRESYVNAEGHERTGTVTLCPDCPTVAKLLAIGVAVMTAKAWDWPKARLRQVTGHIEVEDQRAETAVDLWAQLWAVEP
jgi:hypothetical protein